MSDVRAMGAVSGYRPVDPEEIIEHAQELLGQVGQGVPITRRLDPRTVVALQAFQREEGLPTTGFPDSRTMRALERAADEVRCRGPEVEPSWNDGHPSLTVRLPECRYGGLELSAGELTAGVMRGGGFSGEIRGLRAEIAGRVGSAHARASVTVGEAHGGLGIEAAHGGARFRQDLGASTVSIDGSLESDAGAIEAGLSLGPGHGMSVGRTDADHDGDDELEVMAAQDWWRFGARVE